MRTEQKWSLWWALAVFAQICAMRSLPYDLSGAAAGLWHLLAFAAIALLLWIACDGNRLVFLILRKLKTCAESSRRSPRATSSRS